ncbi:MAG: S8 family peptidase [Candidatus Aminicenantes bacterium]|nr:S8 family peptidase [Candidatus Aminicenantes bacterium]
MRKTHWVLGAGVIAGVTALLVFGGSGLPRAQDSPDHMPGEVLLKFKSSVPIPVKALALAALRSRAQARISPLDVYVVRIPEDATVEEMVEAFGRNPDVAYVQPNYVYRACLTPNDKYFEDQYALFNKGQQVGWVPGSPQGKPSADIKATSAWEETTGAAGVVIGILDSGVDLTHPDLKNKIKSPGYDFVNNDADATDDYGHGTMVAGIAAAETNNYEGIAGVSWNSKILPVKVLNQFGFGDTVAVVNGILWAVDNGAQILNLSFGTPARDTALEEALKYAFETKGVFIAAAAGNDNTAVYYPAAYDRYVCATAATDYNDQRTTWSNFGSEIDVAAPGDKIISTYPVALAQAAGFPPYKFQDGTSMASAYVAGLAALIRGIKPSLTPSEIMNIIRYSADDVNSSIYKGQDVFLGYGRINMEKALVPLKIVK